MEVKWEFYKSSDRSPVEKEIEKCFGKQGQRSKRGRAQLGVLMNNIKNETTLPREVEYLKDGLWEGKLTFEGQEFRLFYGRPSGGLVLLALHLAGKKAQTIPKSIKLARKRLQDYE